MHLCSSSPSGSTHVLCQVVQLLSNVPLQTSYCTRTTDASPPSFGHGASSFSRVANSGSISTEQLKAALHYRRTVSCATQLNPTSPGSSHSRTDKPLNGCSSLRSSLIVRTVTVVCPRGEGLRRAVLLVTTMLALILTRSSDA